jgi:tRNA A-37 threonylcarbamoyl transferase component Bud32
VEGELSFFCFCVFGAELFAYLWLRLRLCRAMIDIGASLIMEGESALLRNTGQLGAGACVSHGSKATLSGSSRVEENTADDDGGGLYMHSSILAIAGEVTLRKNNAFFGGGVFLELSSPLDMTGTSTISENVAGTAGGGVYNLACRTNIGPTSTISGNTAREQPDTGDIFNDDIAVSLAVGVKLVKPEVPTPPPTPSPESDGDEVPMVQMDASFEGEDADTFTGVELEAFKVAVTNVCGSVPVVVSLVRRLAERSKWRRLSAVLTFQIEESSAEELIAAAESGLLLDEYKAALAEARVPADSINVMAITVTNTPDDPAAESSDNVIALDTLSAILISLIILLIVWVAALMYCRLRKRNQQDQTSCFVSDAVSCCSMFRKRSPPLDADHAEVSIPIKDIDKSCIEKEYSALEAPAFGTPMSVSQRTQKSQPSRVSSCQTADMLATALVHMGTNSAIPGIPEVSTLIQVIIRTIKQDDSNRDEQQSTIRWCQNMARTLSCIQEYVENKQLSESSKVVEALFIEIGDVKFKLEELLEVLESYQRMGRVKQFFQSTLTAARKDEAKSLLQDSLTRLQLGLITSIALDEQQRFQQLNEKLAPSTDDATRDTILSNHFSAQALRRKRKEDMFGELEIPASDVLIADAIEQGTISTLHLADYKGRNAIAKVFGTHVTGMFGKVKMDKLRKLFANELHIMRTLRHENVLNVYGAMTSQPDQLVLIMEFTSRGNMREFMDEKSGGNLTPELARKWMIQVSRSLAYAHSKGVIHRDLKSPIILLDSELNCKISDFGLSRITDTITSLSTVGSTWGGSTAWSAPEVLERSLRSQAGDIYSLGVVIWECLTAKEPWSEEGFNGSAIYGAVVQRRERLLVPNGTPSGMRLLVSQCFAHAASERPSAHEIAHALEMGSWMGDELFH